jgi:hypothetical protein
MTSELLVRERRKYERQPCDLRAACAPYASANQIQWAGSVIDLSCNGLRVLTDRRFERGTILRVHLRDGAGDPVFTLLARVVHVNAYDVGQWVLGCQITPELAREDLEELLQQM